MKILIHVHKVGDKFSGADKMCESIQNFLASKGCEIKVANDHQLLGEKYEWSDVVLTNLVLHNQAVEIARRFNKPVFHIVHNDNRTTLLPNEPDNYLIYNSYWLKEKLNLGNPCIVVTPPTFYEDWKSDIDHYERPYVTMVNMTANKGAELFYQLTLHLPYIKFNGVLGGYGEQFQKLSPNRNLNYHPFERNMKNVYDQTKILVVPSKSESWSLCAAEAQASGIPVICSDLPGLRENLGDTAIYCKEKRNFLDAIVELHGTAFYYEMVSRGLERAKGKPHLEELEKLYEFMKKTVKKTLTIEIGNTCGEIELPCNDETEKCLLDSDEDVPEKIEMKPVREKKEIKKPKTKKQCK
jgi:glycosyltransferase involved in cell wall biosynthesis